MGCKKNTRKSIAQENLRVTTNHKRKKKRKTPEGLNKWKGY